jgi:hypothetical protein
MLTEFKALSPEPFEVEVVTDLRPLAGKGAFSGPSLKVDDFW